MVESLRNCGRKLWDRHFSVHFGGQKNVRPTISLLLHQFAFQRGDPFFGVGIDDVIQAEEDIKPIKAASGTTGRPQRSLDGPENLVQFWGTLLWEREPQQRRRTARRH